MPSVATALIKTKEVGIGMEGTELISERRIKCRWCSKQVTAPVTSDNNSYHPDCYEDRTGVNKRLWLMKRYFSVANARLLAPEQWEATQTAQSVDKK